MGDRSSLRMSLTSITSWSCIMHSYLALSLILSILTNLASPTDYDFAESLNYGSLFPDQPTFWDESALSSNLLALTASNDVASLSFSDSEDLSSDTSALIFSSEDLDDDNTMLSSPIDNQLLADSSQQADCSTLLESLPFFDKSRARRRDDLGLCQNNLDDPVGMVTWPDLPGLRELRTKPNAQLLMDRAVGDPRFNGLCFLYSLGRLPYGVCSSGDPRGVKLSMEGPLQIWICGGFLTFEVSHGTLGTSMN